MVVTARIRLRGLGIIRLDWSILVVEEDRYWWEQ